MGTARHVSRSVDRPQRRIGEFRKVAIAIARRLQLCSNRNHQGQVRLPSRISRRIHRRYPQAWTACPILNRYSFHSFEHQHHGVA